jgi:TolA-binding protein
MTLKGWYRFGGAALASAMLAGAAGTAVAQEAGSEYAEVMAEVDRYSQFNAHLEQLLASQQRDIESLTQQIAGLEGTAEQVRPLVEEMFAALEQFVANDLPFLAEERSRRIDTLRVLMQEEGALAEKFRRLLEAYTIEVEYGRNLQAYPGEIDGREVQFIHLGRVSLMYRTTDGEETGYWDRNSKSWVEDSDYARAVEEAIRMAEEALAPDLVTVPVPAPESRS